MCSLFKMSKNKVYHKNKEIDFLCNVTCSSDIITKDNKMYLNLHINESKENLIYGFNDFCKQYISNFKSFINDDKIFVKLPFRYNRFEVEYSNFLTSECFKLNETFNCQLKFCGILKVENSQTCVFKLVSIG